MLSTSDEEDGGLQQDSEGLWKTSRDRRETSSSAEEQRTDRVQQPQLPATIKV